MALTREHFVDLRKKILAEIRAVQQKITDRTSGQTKSVFEKFSYFKAPERYKTQVEFLNVYETMWKQLQCDNVNDHEFKVYNIYSPDMVIARFLDSESIEDIQKKIAKALVNESSTPEQLTQLYDGMVFHEVADLLKKHTGYHSPSDYRADSELVMNYYCSGNYS